MTKFLDYDGLDHLINDQIKTGTFPNMTAGIAPRQFPYRNGTTTIGGRTYNTVIIGNQEWLASDLQYDDGEEGIVTATEGTYIGHLYYTWEAATRVSRAASSDGWRLPTEDEVRTLFNNVGRSIAGALLKSTSGWGNSSSYNGKNSYGLDIWPTGRTISGTNSNQGWNAYYWTANFSEGAGEAFRFAAIETSAPGFYPEATYRHSIRLVRDTSSNISDMPAVGSSLRPMYVSIDGSVKPCFLGIYLYDLSDSNYYRLATLTFRGANDAYAGCQFAVSWRSHGLKSGSGILAISFSEWQDASWGRVYQVACLLRTPEV